MQVVLIANRGEIAVRLVRAVKEYGARAVAVYSEPDAGARHVALADDAVAIGPAAATESYLNLARIIEAARAAGADAIHPGYGFLAENAEFASAVGEAGITFIGPAPATIRAMGDKTRARTLMQAAGVPVIPGAALDAHLLGDEPALLAIARDVGYPLLVKAAAGGGGKGMRLVEAPQTLAASVRLARDEAARAFGDPTVFFERALSRPRHIEVQILGDRHGHVCHVFERECSLQRRHQKVIEEAPAPRLDAALRTKLHDAAVAAARAVDYLGAGTVEFLLDTRTETPYFLEMNTRLQVEHAITEAVTGYDLALAQLAIADGAPLAFDPQRQPPRGHAIECRVYAEDPANGFLPTTGVVLGLDEPRGPGIRVDSALAPGLAITPDYDPMLAKLVVHAETREAAIARLRRALAEYVVLGVTTNLAYLADVVAHPAFARGELHTHFLADHLPDWRPAPVDLDDDLLVAALGLASEYATHEAAAPGNGGSAGAAEDADRHSPWRSLAGWRPGS